MIISTGKKKKKISAGNAMTCPIFPRDKRKLFGRVSDFVGAKSNFVILSFKRKKKSILERK